MIRKKYYDESEVALLKSLFLENDEFFYLLRKLFFETVTTKEMATLRSHLMDVPQTLMERLLIGGVSAENPIGQHRDRLIDQLEMDDVHPELLEIQFNSRMILEAFCQSRVNALYGAQDKLKKLSELQSGDTPEERATNIKARLLIVGMVDNLFLMVRSISQGNANLSLEEMEKRQKQNSAR